LGVALLLALRRSGDPAMRGLMLAMLAVNVYGVHFLPGGAFHDFIERNMRTLASPLWNAGFLYFALRWASGGAMLWSRALVRCGFWCLAAASALRCIPRPPRRGHV
ncbi:MAG TPA: hypothetical protein VFQ20_02460, partial [Burkholderiaceae bacterium]|nr:hypothetical protein [Burkholderiaceae bacterium]